MVTEIDGLLRDPLSRRRLFGMAGAGVAGACGSPRAPKSTAMCSASQVTIALAVERRSRLDSFGSASMYAATTVFSRSTAHRRTASWERSRGKS